jgi:hypothetical protein
MITGVAFFCKDTGMIISLPKPNRHSDVISQMWEAENKRFKEIKWEQGFINDHGKFLSRTDAAKYVLKIGQELTENAKEEYKDRGLTLLFSEDLW